MRTSAYILVVGAIFGSGAGCESGPTSRTAQEPAPTPTAPVPAAIPRAAQRMPEGLILVAKATGRTAMELNGQRGPLVADQRVPVGAKVLTAPDSSAVLVFSNGATLHLGSDTALLIEEFSQEPFSPAITVSAATVEPSVSRTLLRLLYGELVGNVKRPKPHEGSVFKITTPIGTVIPVD